MVGVAIDDATARPVPAPAAHHPPLPPTPPVLAPDQQIDRLAAQVARFLSGGGIAPSLPLGPAGGLPRLLGGLALGLAEGVGDEVAGIAVGASGVVVVTDKRRRRDIYWTPTTVQDEMQARYIHVIPTYMYKTSTAA